MWDGLHMDKERKDWAPLVVDYGEYDPLKVGSIDGTDLRPHDRAITRAIQAKCKFYVILNNTDFLYAFRST